MFKKGIIFGLLGFIVSLILISSTTDDKNTLAPGSAALSFEEGIGGWVSLGNILQENFKTPFLTDDAIFIDIFMLKVMNPIKIPNKPALIITDRNNSIFWTTTARGVGTEYSDWKGTDRNGGLYNADSISIIRIKILSENRSVAGYLYLEVKNKPNPKDFAINGWKYYSSVLSASNTIRNYVANNNRSDLNNYINKVTRKEKIIHFTILGNDNTIIWDIDNSQIGKKLQDDGWVNQENNGNNSAELYYTSSIRQQDTKIGDVHLLVDMSSSGKAGFISSLTAKVKGLFKPSGLLPSAIAFFVFFLAGIVLARGGGSQGATVKKVSTKGTPELENKIQQLKEEINRLEETKDDVTEDVAKKQKTQKDLEKEIKRMEEAKESVATVSAEDLTEEVAEKQKIKEEFEKEIESLKQEKENIAKEIEASKEAAVAAAAEASTKKDESEEDLLFDNLLGGSDKTSAQKKEELELTQRIVAKRREEIELSTKIESRRKELRELEQKIEKLKEK
jgi:hypothetical protein